MTRPAIRVRPAPALEPPFDDEASPQAWAGPGAAEQLAFDWPRPAAGPDRAAARPPGESRPSASLGASAETVVAVRRFVRLCLEILNGYRPTGHVRALTNPAVAPDVIEQLTHAHQRIAEWGVPHRRPATRPPGRAPAPSRQERVDLRRVLVCEPRGGVAEATVVLAGSGGPAMALALRLEQVHGRWLCTVAQTV
jgi:hypothetical protein